jgi:hypothetical protein
VFEGPNADERFDEAAPSSQTPVVFAAVESSRRPRTRRPSLAHRLLPVAMLPVLFACLGIVWLRAAPAIEPRDASAAVATAPIAKHTTSQPRTEADPELEELTLCPTNMSLVARGKTRVCIDRWEASLVEVMKNGEERPHTPYETPNTAHGMKIKAVSMPGVVPQAYVSKYQATIACKAAGKRLCTGDEWRVACEGTTQQTYPYGNKENRKACNTHGKNPMPMLLGTSKTYMWGTAMHHPLLNTFPGTLAKTGQFEQCVSEYGVHDMVGNLHEWTADGDFRGGYYRDDKSNSPGCRYKTTAHGATYSDYSTGFRCCADPQ